MAFQRVDEWFVTIHADIDEDTRDKVANYLIDNNWLEHVVSCDEVVVDGIYSDYQAKKVNDELTEIINKGSK